MNETNEPTNKPLLSYSVAGLSVSMWENTADKPDGGERTYRSVTIRKAYFSRKENQLTTQTLSLTPAEVSCLAGLLERMEDAVIQKSGQTVAF
jgi:hypothetical protein